MGVGAVRYPPKISKENYRQAIAVLAPGFNADDIVRMEIEAGIITVTLRCMAPDGALLLGAHLVQEVHIQPDPA